MKIFRKILSIFLALVLVATTFSPAGSITARATGDYTVTLHSNVPGNDETMSGNIWDGAAIYFCRADSVILGWYDGESGDETLYYHYYVGKNPGKVVCGWNTAPDGTGTQYGFGDSFTMPAANVDLYAQWEDAWTVTTHTNTGTADDFDMTYDVPMGGRIRFSPSTNGYQYVAFYDSNGEFITEFGSGYGTLNMSGYAITGWSEDPSGNGQRYGKYETFTPYGNMDLYMIWEKEYNVILHSNVPGNDETMSGEIGENAVVHFLRYAAVALGWIGDDMADKSLDYNAYFGKNPGHVVSGWNTRPDGTGTAYYPGDEFTMPAADVDLYAQWEDAWVVTTHTNTGTADDFDMTYDVPKGGQIQIQPETDGFQYAYIYDANGVNYTNGGNAYGTLHMSGYSLSGFSEDPSGNGQIYGRNEAIYPSGNMDLYMIWQKAVTVTLHENAPSSNQTATVSGTGYFYASNGYAYFGGEYAYFSFSNPGYTLAGWNTKADGTGTNYSLGDSFEVTADMDLYAVWQKAFTVTLYENASSSSSYSVSVSGIGNFYSSNGDAYLGDGYVYYYFINPGYSIVGWNTKADGTGTYYPVGTSFEVTEDMDLYAVWQKNVTVTLHENAPSSNQTATVSGVGNFYASSTIASFGENSVSYNFSNPGYALVSWNTKADGTGTSYRVTDYFEITVDTDLYAIWAKAYTVTLHDNAGGSTTTVEGCGRFSVSSSYAMFQDLSVYTDFFFENPGYTMLAWNTKADGSGTQYCFYRAFDVTADMDLYAVWGQNCTLTLHGDVDGSGNEVTATAEIAVGTTLHASVYGTTREVAAKLPGGAFKGSTSLTFTRTDAAFAGWKDAAGNNVGSNGELFTVTGNTDLYAVTTTDVVTVTLDFIDTSRFGAPHTMLMARGEAVWNYWEASACIVGYAKDRTTEEYFDRSQFSKGLVVADDDMTLYAVYTLPALGDPFLYDADTKFYYWELSNGTVMARGYDGPVRDVRIPETIAGKTVSNYALSTVFYPYDGSTIHSPVESLVYPDYIPHREDFGGREGAPFEATLFPKLTAITFEGDIPEIEESEFYGLEVDGYYPDTWTTVPPATFGRANHINWIPYHVQEEEMTPVMRVDHQTTAPDEVTVNGEPVDPENYTVVIEGDTVIIEFTESYKESLPPGAEIGVSYGDDTITAEVEEEGMALAVLSVENQEQTVPQGQTAEPVVIVVSGDVEKLEKVYVGGTEAIVGTDVFVTDGSTVLTFTEAFLATLPTDTPLEVEAVFANGVARTEIAVNTPEPSWDDIILHSVSFSNDLKLIYYVDASALEGYENVRLVGKRVKADKTRVNINITMYEIQETNNGKEYRFVLGGIAAKEIGDVVTVHLEAEKNGETRKGPSDVYSVKQYAYSRLRKTEKAHFKTLLVDMLNYCAQAQEYFGYDTENPVNADLTDEERALGTQETPELTNVKEITALEGASAEWTGTNVIFGSNVGLKYYFTLSEAPMEYGVALKVTYTTVTGTEMFVMIPLEECKYDEVHDEYAWTLNDIAVKDMGTVITAQICAGVDIPLSGEHRYSLESYAANRIPKTGDPVFRELLVRLMKYSRSAKAYFEIENP